ncbi:MAG: hypothetical protein AABP62_24675, partial [Planctomycetota bacterium]
MIHPARTLKNLSRAVGIAVLALACCACASSRPVTRSNPPADGPVQAIYHETTEHGDTARATRDSQIQQLAHETEAPGETRLTSKSRPERKSAGVIQQVTFTEQAAATLPECPPQFTINQCPPEPRWAAPCPNPFAPGMVGGQCESTLLLEKFPDEYLCDGGDRALPVHYDSYNRLGLDTEDTVAEYTDHTGKNRVKASNRVCVYAPRFATVRTISRPHEDSHLNRIADVDHAAGTNAMHTRLKASLHVKQEMTGRVAVRSRAGGLESEQLQGDISQTKRL